jgi:drug/metabolite transporter (DMT)-like permease
MTTTTAAMRPPATALIGALFVLGAGLSWSFTGALLRLAPHLDAWQIQTYRGFGTACAFALLSIRQGRPVTWSAFVSLGLLGPIVMVALSVASVGFIVAIKLTTVANALFLSSCSPLLSAVLGYVILRERLSRPQVLAVALGFAGLLTIVGGGFEAGNGVGNIAALLSALGFASASICMRLTPSANFNPAMVAFGALSCAVSAAMCVATGSAVIVSPSETLVAFASGFVLIGGGFALFLRGAPWVPAVGQTVLAQTETVFGPIWVWLAFGEAPASTTLIGGAVILVAVVAMAFASGGSMKRVPTSEL